MAVSLDNISPERRLMITLKIMESLDTWGLSGEQIMAILDFPDGHRSRHLQKYRKDTPLPDVESVNLRVIRLLGIIDALRTTYPRNDQMGPRWMNTPHRRMQDRTPVHTMLEDGEVGVITVLSELDCAYAWELSGSTTPSNA
jgi:uncharacterized protein (DUF2384 family)